MFKEQFLSKLKYEKDLAANKIATSEWWKYRVSMLNPGVTQYVYSVTDNSTKCGLLLEFIDFLDGNGFRVMRILEDQTWHVYVKPEDTYEP